MQFSIHFKIFKNVQGRFESDNCVVNKQKFCV